MGYRRNMLRQRVDNNSKNNNQGFTLVEVVIGITVLGVVAASFLGLFVSLVNSGLVSKRIAVASSLATNQIEYLKSLPYDDLAVVGGSIPHSSPLPASKVETSDGFDYVVKTSINYVDDAFDGCGDYPDEATKQNLCRNYPPPASVTADDTNPADYKILHVSVENSSGDVFAKVDTQVAAKVAETDSTTGALVVNVIDGDANPVQGVTVNVTNTTTSPNVNVSDSTDSNGIAIFYSLPPDTSGSDYNITATKNNYSSLSTIKSNGSLQATYANQNILTQQSSQVTLTLLPQGANSSMLEAFDTSGSPISNLSIYIKGGYKKYNSATDTEYYFDNVTPTNTRPTTNGSGQAAVSNLVPGPYYFCGDTGAIACSSGGTTFYLVSAIPNSGTTALSPVYVPTYLSSSPPSPSYNFSGTEYYQKATLILSTSSTFPRVHTISGSEVSISTDVLSNYSFGLTGRNLPCNPTVPASCSTVVRIKQASNTYTASCTGSPDATTGADNLGCTVNISGISAGTTQLEISTASGTYTSPSGLKFGSIYVTP